MTHRPEDVYGYVATQVITIGTVTAFNVGDPVPDATVDENPEWLKDGSVVSRDKWDDRPADEPERSMKRGEMPPHLRDKVAGDAENATAGTTAAGGASRKTPAASKGSATKSGEKNT